MGGNRKESDKYGSVEVTRMLTALSDIARSRSLMIAGVGSRMEGLDAKDSVLGSNKVLLAVASQIREGLDQAAVA